MEFDDDKALNVMTNVLQFNRDINGVYAANDEMALGVIAAAAAIQQCRWVSPAGRDAPTVLGTPPSAYRWGALSEARPTIRRDPGPEPDVNT